jgi:HTH DNA binding domain
MPLDREARPAHAVEPTRTHVGSSAPPEVDTVLGPRHRSNPISSESGSGALALRAQLCRSVRSPTGTGRIARRPVPAAPRGTGAQASGAEPVRGGRGLNLDAGLRAGLRPTRRGRSVSDGTTRLHGTFIEAPTRRQHGCRIMLRRSLRSPHRSRRGRTPRSPDRRRVAPLVEVRFPPARSGHPLTELLHREGAETRLVACRLVSRPSRHLLRWLDVRVPQDRREHLLASLGRRRKGYEFAAALLGPTRLLLRIRERAPAACLAAYRAGGICVGCPLVGRSEGEGWRIVIPRGSRTGPLLRAIPPGGASEPGIARLGPYRSSTTLTGRQERALHVAFELGYFDYPRRGTLGDVARVLGAGRSATLEVLRRALSKLAGERYGNELRARSLG